MGKILVSVSGGETSAMLAYLVNKHYGAEHEIIYVFANTSREKEETLVFLDNLRKYWGINVVWVEAFVHPQEGTGTTHKVVDFETAKRNGEVFRDMISKYGIPNQTFKHCTRELKTRPIESYARSLGWAKGKKGNYKIAIGYRADEMKRVSWGKEATQQHWYLLPRLGIKKADVKKFFALQPFQLGLKEYEGNCKVCFKKNRRKLLTQIVEDPQCLDWINQMEIEFGNYVTGDRDIKEPMPFRFFRGYDSAADLVEESKLPFEMWVDKTNLQNMSEFNAEMDYEEECAESCEPF